MPDVFTVFLNKDDDDDDDDDENIKTSFPNGFSGIFLVESIEGWLKTQDKTSKQTSDHQTNQRKSIHESQVNINHEASVTSYVYEIRQKIRGPFDGC